MPQLTMPNVGEGVTEGTVTRWLKHAGDDVALDEPVVEVETDKAVVEIPSPFASRLEKILVEEGEVVPIGAALAEFAATGGGGHHNDDAPEAAAGAGTAPPSANGMVAPGAAATGRKAAPVAAPNANDGGTRDGDGYHRRRMYSPVVLRLAAEHDIDLGLVQGTGIEGRVTRQDVAAYIENPVMHTVPPGADSGVVGVSQREQARGRSGGRPAEPTPAAIAPEPGVIATPARGREVVSGQPVDTAARSGDEREERIALTPTRRTIAARMLESQQTVPAAWMLIEADVSGLVALRERRRGEFEQAEGVALTYMPFFVRAIVGALKEHPLLNSAYGDGEIVVHHRYDIGVAVAAESGLVVPVVRDADRRSMSGLAHELRQLGEKARTRKLSVEEMRAPTFTIDNTGTFGSIASQPIVPPGQAAIITTEAVRRELRVRDDGAFEVRSVMNLCISFDHRALDGAQVGVFMQAVRRRLEAYAADDEIW